MYLVSSQDSILRFICLALQVTIKTNLLGEHFFLAVLHFMVGVFVAISYPARWHLTRGYLDEFGMIWLSLTTAVL